jgi:23S rRNA (pseudouridine1915-N3)-methyltransferase
VQELRIEITGTTEIMLNISLVAVGEKMPQWIDHGFREYQKRIRGNARLNLVEVAATRRGKNADTARIVQAEEKKLIAAIPANNHVIALDRTGKAFSTLELSDILKHWMMDGTQVSLVVGGPEGLSEDFLSLADENWSLSTFTFAHPLVRLVVAEQFYRCLSILDGSPYHR